MKKLTLISTLLLSACSTVDSVQVFDQQQAAILLKQQHQMYPTQQMIKLDLPDKNAWKKVDMSYGTVGTPIMLIPEQQTRETWTQSFRTQIRGRRQTPDITAKHFVREIISAAKANCPAADGEITNEQSNQLEYKLKIQHCDTEPDQIQLGKAFNGEDAIYIVYYTAKTNAVDTQQIVQNAHVINSAKLVKSRR